MIKVLTLPDFPALAPYLRPVYGDWFYFRKPWEVGQALRWLGEISPTAEILIVGAGHDAITFLLTRWAQRVFATDLYAEPGLWHKEADSNMLVNPRPFAPPGIQWDPNRLVVQHMDARHLRFEDSSFDAVVSLGSIEHFGTFEDSAAAMREMRRVLKPGGRIALTTEFKLAGTGDGWPGVNLFTEAGLYQSIIEPTGLDAGAADWTVDEATMARVMPLEAYVFGGRAGDDIVLTNHGFTFTSVFVGLQNGND